MWSSWSSARAGTSRSPSTYPPRTPPLAGGTRPTNRSRSPGRSRAWPDVPTRYLLCRDDRMFTAEWARRHARDRLGITPDETDGGHYVSLSRPRELADRLDADAAEVLA
ncbi:MAG TPA: alpha/beta fold hydrolase [Gaiellaceae bacterium]|nr:alpha/beta fold hydrolase [Gaiellaceae bacterium]HXV95747.1 alpha/beta fold hydrolase [Gaiellaceae bacterium]